jgi:predicted nucleotidyltransferase
MIDLITQKKDEIAAHCRRLDVRRLEVFGSAARGTFDPETSDLDFIVEFDDWENIERADRYFDLADSLAVLFSKKVDLLTSRSIRKPRLKANIEKEKEVVYAVL